MFSLPFDSKIIGYDSSGIPQYDRASGSAEFARLLAAFLTNGVFGSGMFAVTAKYAVGGGERGQLRDRRAVRLCHRA